MPRQHPQLADTVHLRIAPPAVSSDRLDNRGTTVIDRERWRALEPLLDRALDLSDEERGSWMDELRARSPMLADELGALLASEAAADRHGFLLDPPEATLAGMTLGAYTLVRPLGQGGMGTVWLARRTDGRFEGAAAVKLLNLALVSPVGQARFRREGSMLARLAHPGISRLLDAGVAPGGQPYLVLEHVDGEPIDQFATVRLLGTDARIRLVLQVLAAVGHAHASLIVHRDLKPSNILVTRDGTVKLLDFGIAKLIDPEGTDPQTALTADGGRVLTPEFAAPEQARGETITTATDVYAVGVLLYLMLAGWHPTARGRRTPPEIFTALYTVEPAKLGLGDLDTVIGKALRKNPAERYQTVSAFADDLQRYLRHEPVAARPDTLAYRAGKFIRRHRAAVAAATITVSALIGATLFSVGQMREARLQRDAAMRDATRSQAMSDLQAVLGGDARGPDGHPLSGVERVSLAEEVATRKYAGTPWLAAELMIDLAGRLYESGNRVPQRAMLARAHAFAGGAGLAMPAALANCERANSFVYDDMLDSARVELRAAHAWFAKAREPNDPVVQWLCLDAEGQTLVAEGKSDSGIAYLHRALALVMADSLGTHRLQALNDLAEALRLSGRMREAVPYQREVVTTLNASGYGGAEQVPNVLSFLAGSLSELGEFVTLDAELRPYVREQEARLGAGRVPPILAFLYGQNKLRLGALDSADLWLGRAMRDTTDRGELVRWLPAVIVQLRLEQGRLADARRAMPDVPVSSRGRRVTAAMLRARLRRASGDAAGASAPLEDSIRVVVNDGKQSITFFAPPLIFAGELRLAAGDARGADSLALLGRAAAASDSLALRRSAFAGDAELLRARARQALGDLAGARAAADRAIAALAVGYGPTHRSTAAARALRETLAP